MQDLLAHLSTSGDDTAAPSYTFWTSCSNLRYLLHYKSLFFVAVDKHQLPGLWHDCTVPLAKKQSTGSR